MHRGRYYWLALCMNPDCGRLTTPLGQDASLNQCLDVPVHVSSRPWVRTFVRASRIPHCRPWRIARTCCVQCGESDLVFELQLYPVSSPYRAFLCLACGGLKTEHMTDGGSFSELIGGTDWGVHDDAAAALRRGLSEKERLGPEPPPSFGLALE